MATFYSISCVGTGKEVRLNTLVYRLWQVRQQLGFVAPLALNKQQEVAQRLPPAAWHLFKMMSDADQQHAWRVYQGLVIRGCADPELLTAALLHDVGKAAGRVPFWTRPVIVLGQKCAPRLLTRLTVYPLEPGQKLVGWRRALSSAWWHAEIGADLAAQAGLTVRAVHYIRVHHRPDSQAVTELHLVDEAS